VAYECERSLGLAVPGDLLQSSLRRLVRRQQCFKAFPACFCHVNAEVVLASLLRRPAARDVLYAPQTQTQSAANIGSARVAYTDSSRVPRLAVRAKLFVYPRGVCALWLMIAAVYDLPE
jgi:hypothetical protein